MFPAPLAFSQIPPRVLTRSLWGADEATSASLPEDLMCWGVLVMGPLSGGVIGLLLLS